MSQPVTVGAGPAEVGTRQALPLRTPSTLVDWSIAIGLALLVAATRLPFRTTMLYNWDSANFAQALDHFDVTRHFPHPPGYFFYVAAAKLLRVLVPDANASLVVLGILFSALAVAALYFLGKTIFDRPTGIVTALLLTFSVTYWSLGTVALPYVTLAFFSTAMAYLAYRSAFAGRDHTVPLSIVYAVGGGFRPDLLLFLGPLWVLGMARRPLRKIALGFFLVLGGFLLWYVPTVWLSGGVEGYHSTLLAYLQIDVVQKYSSTHRGPAALLVNVRDTLSYIFYALYFAAVPALAGAVHLLRRARSIDWRFAGFVVCWIVPMALFYVFIHVGDPGYVFTIIPALLLLAARALTWPLRRHEPVGASPAQAPDPSAQGSGDRPALPPDRHDVGVLPRKDRVRPGRGAGRFPLSLWERAGVRASILLTALVLAGNIGLALSYPRQLTLVGIRSSDEALRRKVEYLREKVNPGSSLLVSYETYRHLQYYLPRHDASWVDIFDPREQVAGIPSGAAQVILVDKSLQGLGLDDRAQESPAGMRVVPLRGEKSLVFGQGRLTLK